MEDVAVKRKALEELFDEMNAAHAALIEAQMALREAEDELKSHLIATRDLSMLMINKSAVRKAVLWNKVNR